CLQKSKTVGARSFKTTVLGHYDSIHRAYPSRGRINPVAHAQCRFFMRKCNVAAGKTELRQGANSCLKTVGLDRQWHVGAIDSVPAQPEIMQPR
ncbi:uncharacterized protein METZ01_LOCUS311317, partial [marine metagenome]